MTLRLIPKEFFFEIYEYIVIKTLEILAENFPSLISAAEKRLKEIKESPDAFKKEVSTLLQGLSYHYKKISASKDPLKIEAVTRRTFIPYKDGATKSEGIKDAGKYLVTINLKELCQGKGGEV